MKHQLSRVTWHYLIITAGFWMAFCVFTAYAGIFLLAEENAAGYSSLEMGLILAAGNISGALLSPVLGAWIDRNRKVRHAHVVYTLLALQTIMLALLWSHPVKSTLCSVCYTLYMMFAIPVNAVNLDLCVRLERAKAPLNFNFARSMGSMAFVILSTLLGILTKKAGYQILPVAGLCVILIQLAGNRLVDKDLRKAEESTEAAREENVPEKSSSMAVFIRENKAFCLMLFGTIWIFIAHNMDGNFLIKLVNNVGGGPEIMGYIASFTAIVEIPVMMFAGFLLKYRSRVWYIRAAFLFFVAKILAYALAPNIPLLFASRILQAPSYALYTVLIVGYANETVAQKDSAKAQSLAFSMTTIGSVLASLIGGWLFDKTGVQPTMLIATGIAAAGAVIAISGTIQKQPEKMAGRENT